MLRCWQWLQYIEVQLELSKHLQFLEYSHHTDFLQRHLETTSRLPAVFDRNLWPDLIIQLRRWSPPGQPALQHLCPSWERILLHWFHRHRHWELPGERTEPRWNVAPGGQLHHGLHRDYWRRRLCWSEHQLRQVLWERPQPGPHLVSHCDHFHQPDALQGGGGLRRDRGWYSSGVQHGVLQRFQFILLTDGLLIVIKNCQNQTRVKFWCRDLMKSEIRSKTNLMHWNVRPALMWMIFPNNNSHKLYFYHQQHILSSKSKQFQGHFYISLGF